MDKNTNEESLSNALNNPRTESNNTRRSEATNSTQVTLHVPSNEQNFEPSAPEMDLSPFPPTYEEAMHMKSTNSYNIKMQQSANKEMSCDESDAKLCIKSSPMPKLRKEFGLHCG